MIQIIPAILTDSFEELQKAIQLIEPHTDRAHLDIAGTAWVSGNNRNATGRPVPLLLEFVRHAAKS